MKIYIIPIEPIDNRYTKHWYDYIPNQLIAETNKDIRIVDGFTLDNKTTPGAFLNFNSTVYYKNSQMLAISNLFHENHINPGDYFLFMDAWNPNCLNLKYISDLLDIPVNIGGLWHAGSYDKDDILGAKIKNRKWSMTLEKSMYEAYDHNFFASDHHIDFFHNQLYIENTKSIRTGWPMEYYDDILPINMNDNIKEDIIVFPHRISPEKQLRTFKNLEREFPNFEFFVTQEHDLTKEQYYDILRKAKIVFSASLHENLGISMYEAMRMGCLPIVPDRLSYREMYAESFVYSDSVSMKSMIPKFMNNREDFLKNLNTNLNFLNKYYFNGEILYKTILNIL